ncbi:hypothetical protein L917_13435, partial [Phytophthora nicotianae]
LAKPEFDRKKFNEYNITIKTTSSSENLFITKINSSSRKPSNTTGKTSSNREELPPPKSL